MNETLQIRKRIPVVTADGVRLGDSVRLFQREEEVNPALKLYETYLVVRSWSLGDQYYVPLDFVAEVDAISAQVNLLLSSRQVEDATLSRLPQFVVAGKARTIELP